MELGWSQMNHCKLVVSLSIDKDVNVCISVCRHIAFTNEHT